MFKIRRTLKKVVCSCLLITGCMISGISALAAANGSIQISYRGRTDEETVILSDAPFALYYAGALENGVWKLSEEFRNSGVSLENTDSSERKKQAEKLYAFAATEGISGTEQETDASGIARFSTLQEGVYLIAQSREVRKGNWIFRSAPFLVSVPVKDNGKTIWDIVIEPKSGWTDTSPGGGSEEETDNGSEDSSSEPEEIKETEMLQLLPAVKEEAKNAETMKTGDSAMAGTWLIVLIISACVTVFLYWRSRRTGEAEDSDTDDQEEEQP